jgi:hypothetical protein
MSRSLRTVALMFLLGLSGAGTGQAMATTATGTQNPQLSVTVSLSSDGENPDRATVGDEVTASFSVINNRNVVKTVRITGTVITPSGQTLRATERRTLGPRETYTFTYTYPVEPSFDKGIYRFRVAATNPTGTSRATARIEIF